MLLKSMFLMHTVRSTVDINMLSKILYVIRKRIEDLHENITISDWDDTSGKMRIAYTAPGTTKPRFATITFGEKDIRSIFDKLARRPSYMSPDMLNDIARMNIDFEEEEGDDIARVWLIRELSQIIF